MYSAAGFIVFLLYCHIQHTLSVSVYSIFNNKGIASTENDADKILSIKQIERELTEERGDNNWSKTELPGKLSKLLRSKRGGRSKSSSSGESSSSEERKKTSTTTAKNNVGLPNTPTTVLPHILPPTRNSSRGLSRTKRNTYAQSSAGTWKGPYGFPGMPNFQMENSPQAPGNFPPFFMNMNGTSPMAFNFTFPDFSNITEQILQFNRDMAKNYSAFLNNDSFMKSFSAINVTQQ